MEEKKELEIKDYVTYSISAFMTIVVESIEQKQTNFIKLYNIEDQTQILFALEDEDWGLFIGRCVSAIMSMDEPEEVKYTAHILLIQLTELFERYRNVVSAE